jgi:hypothetical protein
MASLFSLLSGWLSSRSAVRDYQVAATYTDLRNMVLTTKPETLGLMPTASEVWGVLMETGHPDGVASLVVLADGTVSLYFSNGGGIIGLGPHLGPQRIGKELLASAQRFTMLANLTKDFPLPRPTFTRFYLLTGSGVLAAAAKEDDLGYQRHRLSPLFHKAHELISEIRIVDEKLRTNLP